jgi:hypothetical protein
MFWVCSDTLPLIVAPLRGGFVQLYGTQLLVKPAGGDESGNIGVHQDIQYWQKQWLPGSQAFTVTIAMSEIENVEDGAISFWQGTHRWEGLGIDAHGVLPAAASPKTSAAAGPTAAAAAADGGLFAALGDFYSSDLEGHREALAEQAASRGMAPLAEVVGCLPRGGICIHDCRTM